MGDGEVVETLDEASNHNGLDLNPGAMKVHYAGGKRFKWIDPAFAATLLKASYRPRPPPFRSGELNKETHSIFAEWHVRWFELSKGYVMWWKYKEYREQGKPAIAIIPLLGLSLNVQGTQISFWTFSTKGTMFSISAPTVTEANEWARCMIDHAGYSAKMKEYLEAEEAAEENGEYG